MTKYLRAQNKIIFAALWVLDKREYYYHAFTQFAIQIGPTIGKKKIKR
jgi:hypothetical protein